MEKLARALEAVVRNEGDPEDGTLDKAAKEWAVFALGVYRGDLLARALDISRSLADFTAKLEELKK